MCIKAIICCADVYYVNSQSVAGCQNHGRTIKGKGIAAGFQRHINSETERVTVNSNQYSLSETSLYQLLWITDAPTQALL